MSPGSSVPSEAARRSPQFQFEDRRAGVSRSQGRSAAAMPQRQMAQAEMRHEGLSARLDVHRQRMEAGGFAAGIRQDSGARFVGVPARFEGRRAFHLNARYYDRPDLVRYGDRHLYMYYDRYHSLHHRVIWPGYYYPVYYPFGPSLYCDYVWPYYHRKYVFISLGGWWPYDYAYLRYYWYGYHPYAWYGYYPVPYETPGGYYTYDEGDNGYSPYGPDTPMDPVTQARLQAQVEQQQAVPPAAQTLADTRFDEGVKSFEAGDYPTAAAKFNEARRLSSQDMILPFAYAQALFAEEQYSLAADVLRAALRNATPDREGVFFPRGLYSNDDVLFAQVEKLVDKVDRTGGDADLQLLLGYQLLGVGETGYAREPLEQAAQDPQDAAAAGILLNVLDKMEKEAGASGKTNGDRIKLPAPQTSQPGSAATIGEMMSDAQAGTAVGTAGAAVTPAEPVEGTPPESAETVPPIPPQEKPDAAPAHEPAVGPTEEPAPPAENNDNPGLVETGHEGENSAGLVTAEVGGSPASLVSSLSRLLGRHGPNHRVDLAIFVSVLSLALAGVWIEWRLGDRRPL